MEQLILNTDKLIKYRNESPNRFYTLLSDFVVKNEKEERYISENLLPKVYFLYDKNILRKDLLYLSLLAGQNLQLLQQFINYDKLNFKLDLGNPVSFYDHCIYKRSNWLCDVIDNLECYEESITCKDIYNKLVALKLIQTTNGPIIDVDRIRKLIKRVNVDCQTDFLKFYVQEMNIELHSVQFCQHLNESLDSNEAFRFANQNTLLGMVSNFVDLNEASHWDLIAKKMSENEGNTFTSFIIIASLIHLIRQNFKTHKNIFFENTRDKIVGMKDRNLQLELLENIFSLLFYKSSNEFACKEKEIRLILTLLETVINDLKIKKDNEESINQKLTTLFKYTTDALWRLEVVLNVKTSAKTEDQLLNYMLSPPESLIHLCLQRENFQRAYEVIQIFNMEKTSVVQEINYAEDYQKFTKFLKRSGEIKNFKGAVESFLNVHQRNTKELGLDLLDLVFIQTKTKEDTEAMVNLVKNAIFLQEQSSYANFYYRILEIWRETDEENNISMVDLLLSPKFCLDINTHRSKQELYAVLTVLYDNFLTQRNTAEDGKLNRNHTSHKTFIQINEICYKFARESLQFLLRVYNYLQAFSHVLYIEEDNSKIVSKGKNKPFFELLNYNRSELIGNLLFEKHLDPAEFEKYFGKLKLDFLYHIVGNCFPTINLHVHENVTIEELYHDNMMYVPNENIIVYIQKRNWLLAFILNEMYTIEGLKIDISQNRLQTFFNYLKLPKIDHLKVLFDKNMIVTALQNCINAQKVKLYFQDKIVKHDLVSINSGNSGNNEDLETAEEILEDAKTTNWKSLYDTIESIPENQMRKKSDLIKTKDEILVSLVQDAFEPEHYFYTLSISNRDARIEAILNNFKRWPGKSAGDIIMCEITRFDRLEDSKMEILRNWLLKIDLCERLTTVFDVKSWSKSFSICVKHPEDALNKIIVTNEVDILLDFIKVFAPAEDLLKNIESNYFTRIIESDVPLIKVKVLLDSLPFNHSINICNNLLAILRNLESLQFVAGYLKNNVSDDILLRSVQVSLKILSVFNTTEQEQCFALINEPLSLLEMLLMNTKLDKLGAVLDVLQLNSQDYDKDVISVEKVDQLLRKYAEKSLDFRVITHPTPASHRSPEYKLLQSLDSLNIDRKQFMVPENVPRKEEWIPNEEVLECMCCRQVVFSMFNRRHHCRRCGRVICYNCSLKRMLVPTYGDILVRVCSDCYEQTIGSSCSSEKSDMQSLRSLNQEYWILNDDPDHNKIVREEFSYEHAPSTSLCLSILRYHSQAVEYPKFLLEQCEVMLKLLQPAQELTHEIDYLLVIKMLKSLAMAAKVLCAEHMLNNGASTADRILSQAELLALLAERGCLSLMPVLNPQSSYVDAAVLRRLRDKLLQREQWNLALEVSTKAGLDNTGVFAAWGKSCLKAGSIFLAREKFQRCFEKKYETRFSESESSRSRLSSGQGTSESRPGKVPPLLHEIIQILETKTRTIHVQEKSARAVLSSSTYSLNQLVGNSDTALSVLNRIKNLKELAAGNYSLCIPSTIPTRRPTIDPIFYDECVYYLTRYGTILSLLEFYVRHSNYQKALMFIIDNNLPHETFIEIYLKCLKDGVVDNLQEHMSRIDSSLDTWKSYLKPLCRYLENQNLLNCLYQLQLYIGDYVRAAMTCVRFYKDDVKNFSELAGNVGYLYKTEEHLKQVLEQEQWVDVSSVGRNSADSKDGFEEKTLANPDLVMKIDNNAVETYIATVRLQIEAVDFMAKCEAAGIKTSESLKTLYGVDAKEGAEQPFVIPSLFGSNQERINLAVLTIISDENVEEGFEISSKLIKEFKLRPIKVYCLAGKILARGERYNEIIQLVNLIKSTGTNDSVVSDMLDEMLIHAVSTLAKTGVSGTKVEDLIKLIKDRATKISAYIEARQLKTAYMLAVKSKRTADVRRIQREAELLNIPQIKILCQNFLQNYSTATHSKD